MVKLFSLLARAAVGSSVWNLNREEDTNPLIFLFVQSVIRWRIYYDPVGGQGTSSLWPPGTR